MNGHLFCGCPESLFRRGGRVRAWTKRHLLWMVAEYIEQLGALAQEAAYRQAFKNWSDVCGLTFEETNDKGEADLLILNRKIDGPGGTLAEHQLPFGDDAQLWGSFDSGDKWTTQKPHGPDVIDLVTVACHEFGHGIGLPHLKTPGSLLLPYYDPKISAPQPADIAEAQLRYGPPLTTPEPVATSPLLVRVEDVALDIVWTGEVFPERLSAT